MTKIQLIATLCALIIMVFFASCSDEDHDDIDVFKVTPELRARINTGMKLVPKSEKNVFEDKFIALLNKCDSMSDPGNPYQYLETDEYKDFKEYVMASSTPILYLLMDRYLKRNPVFFSYMLSDIIDSVSPEVADKIAARLKSITTVRESMELYPQVCLETWMDSFENQ